MKRAISLFLALVLLFTSAGPGLRLYVNATSEIPTFSAIGGAVMFEAEAAQLHEDYTELTTDENASGSTAVQMTNEPDNVAFVGSKYPNNLDWFGGKSTGNPIAAIDPGIQFNFVPDQAGTYYVWVRLLCSVKAQTTVWGSVKNAKYVYEPVTTNYSSEYQWVKLTNVKVDITDTQINQAVNLRFRARNLGMQWDKFLLTNNADYTPEGLDPVLPKPTPTFRAEDGIVVFEAENTKLYDLNSDLVDQAANASGDVAVKLTNEQYNNTPFTVNNNTLDSYTEEYLSQFAYNASKETYGNAKATVDPSIDFNFVPDQSGEYYIWVRMLCSDKPQASVYFWNKYLKNTANYGYLTATSVYSSDYQWVKLDTELIVPNEDVDQILNIRFRARGVGMQWDKFLITNKADYIPEGVDPVLPEITIPVFDTANGSVMIEAEDTALKSAFTNLVTGDEAIVSGGEAVELTNTPKVAFVKAKTENDPTLFQANGNPLATVDAGINFTFVPDVAGTYRIWVRQICTGNSQDTIWYSIDNGTYYYVQTTSDYGTDYAWASVLSVTVAAVDVGKPINLRFRGRDIGAVWDKFLITSALSFTPEGADPELPDGSVLDVIEMPAYKDASGDVFVPTVTPPANEHPRLMFTKSDLPSIRWNLSLPENAQAYRMFLELKDQDCDGALDVSAEHNYDANVLAVIEAKAFDYVINGNTRNGEEAVAAIMKYLETYKNPDGGTYYRQAGHGIFTAAEVYDWCYDLLDSDEKREIVARCQMVGMLYMSIGFPPERLSALVSHGSEAQLLRDWMSLAIVSYDEYPSIYNYVAARYYVEYVPARNFFYQSGGHYQGNYYGPYRFTWDLWAQTMLSNMSKTDSLEAIYTPQTQQVLYQWLYARRPDGELLREGDDGTERYPLASQWYKYTNYPFFLASNFYKDGAIKNEFLAHATIPAGYDYLTSVQMLALNDPTIERISAHQLPLSKYVGCPIGAMYARTGWNMGIDSPDVLAYMKIGQTWASNHVHRDAGSFQIYYKGILASESGEYQIYNDDHNELYNQSSIAHNTLGITSAANPTGVQRIPNKVSSGNTGLQYLTIDELIADAADNTTGEVLGQEFGPDIYAPEYTYISGDIAAAYDANVLEAIRSMLFLPLDNEDHPAVFIVMDRITTSEVGSKKTFMLHMQSEPTIDGNVIVITNTATDYNGTYNGMLTNQMLTPYDTITGIGGEGYRFCVGGTNYEPDSKRYSEDGMEAGWGRVEIAITTTKANQTDFFLNVMYVNDADKTLEFEQAIKIETAQLLGAKIFNRIAVFNKEKERTADVLTFEIPADADVTTYQVNVAGLKAGTWTVSTSDGQTQTVVASDEGGIIYFDAPAGTCTVTYTSEDSEKDFTENKPDAVVGFDIKVDDSYIYTPVNAFLVGEELYLPVETLFAAMGGTTTENDGTVTIEYRGNVITLSADKAVITPDGKSAVETTDIKDVGGEYLLAQAFLENTLGGYLEIELNELAAVVEVMETEPDAIQVENTTQYENTEASSSIANALDGDMNTYWGVQGENGAELGIFDLGKVHNLNEIQIAFHNGGERKTSFDVYASVDGQTYVKVGQTRTSSGTTDDHESFELEGIQARYIKLCGYGYVKNTDGATGVWNSFKEIRFLGQAAPKISFISAALLFRDDIQIKFYVNVQDETAQLLENAGFEIWSEADYDAANLGMPTTVLTGLEKNGDRYQAVTDGIAAKNMGDLLYVRAYIIVDGEKFCTDIISYSPAIYCQNQINAATENPADEELQSLAALCISLMNYGAEAQKYFAATTDYTYDTLMNSFMTDEQRTWSYDSSALIPTKPLPIYSWAAADAEVVKLYSASVIMTGALQIKLYIETGDQIESVQLLYWTEADVATELSLDTAKPLADIGLNDGRYQGYIKGIAAKNIGDTVYICAAVTKDGETYYTAPMAYSIHTYASNMIDQENAISDLVKTLVLYGNAAKAYISEYNP
jgi:heparin/heparan-sulfate lyase